MMTSNLVLYRSHHSTYHNDYLFNNYSHSPLILVVSLCKQTASPKTKEQPSHIEAVAAVDAHSSAAKAPAQHQRPPPKSSSVRVYVLNCLYCVTPVAPPRATVMLVSQPFASHSLEQALKKLSAQELCLLMKELNLNQCARVFEELGLEGADLLELSKEEVVSMLTDTGGIGNAHHACL